MCGIRVLYIFPIARPWPGLQSETALSPFLFACPLGLPQVLRSIRFPSARSHCFGNVAFNLTPLCVLGSLERYSEDSWHYHRTQLPRYVTSNNAMEYEVACRCDRTENTPVLLQ